MEDTKRIYSLLLQNKGLKTREISEELSLDKYYVAEILFSIENTSYWFQDDKSLWFAKEGALPIEEAKENVSKLIEPIGISQNFNINRFLKGNVSKALRIYLYQISKFHVYSNEEVLELFERYHNGNRQAFELLVKSHQRLVANIALNYSRILPLEELIQEGNIGLVKAIQRFDYTKFYSFPNYARNWIFQALLNAISYISYSIRFPINQLILHRKVRLFKEKYEQIHECIPSINDIEINEDIGIKKLIEIYQYPDNLKEVVKNYDDMDSFESDGSFGEFYDDREYNNYLVHILLSKLKKKDRYIVKSYYGIDMMENPISAIGEQLNLSYERVRQILWNSINSLRDYSNVRRGKVKIKIGDYINILPSNQIGRVVGILMDNDGPKTITLRMKSGAINEISGETQYINIDKNLMRTFEQYQEQQVKKTTIDIVPAYQEVTKLNGLEVGNKIYYNNLYCTIKKIIKDNNSSKLIIEYVNGVRDVVSYNRDKICRSIPRKRRIR